MLLPYGDRVYGKTVTVINRSEVVGRPLAALLANDGARVFSVDINDTQEYTKRPRAEDSAATRQYHTRHVMRPSALSLQECLGMSDVVISAVPNAEYKIKTEWLKDGCFCLNVAADKNFEKDVRERVRFFLQPVLRTTLTEHGPGCDVSPFGRQGHDYDATAQPVRLFPVFHCMSSDRGFQLAFARL